ncbi:hypothetical protein KC349_g6677 [Hortaea werneckii]|nr:hypothetical protein KC349_g6677 [Hortaea werneckii]
MASFLITGGNRGLGLAIVKELISRPTSNVTKIVATTRNPSPELDELVRESSGRLAVIALDVSSELSVKQAVPQLDMALAGKGLDVLINNAGIAQYAMDGTISMDNLQESMLVNVLGVHWVTRHFLPFLQQGKLKKVVNVSTTLGSLALAPAYTFMPAPAYKISKAALNALTVQYALHFGAKGYSFMALCPGWLKTDLGGVDAADLTPQEGAKGLLDVVDRPNSETNGRMPKILVPGWENVQGPNVYDGSDAPW